MKEFPLHALQANSLISQKGIIPFQGKHKSSKILSAVIVTILK